MGQNCIIKITLYCFAVAIGIFMLSYLLAILWVNAKVREFVNRYNINEEQFCKGLTGIFYSEETYIPYENGRYEQRLAKALLDIAFAVSQANCENFANAIPNPPGFNEQLKLSGLNPFSDSIEFVGFIFWNQQLEQAVFAFSNTKTLDQWLADIHYKQLPPTELNNYHPPMMVHEGFYKIYLGIRDQLWKWWDQNKSWVKTLYVCGHSLGSSISCLCVYDFALAITNGKNSMTGTQEQFNLPIHYSFAGPLVGNTGYSNAFNSLVPTSLRIYNTSDVVIGLPVAKIGPYVYEQTSQPVAFTLSLDSLSDNHTKAYNNLPICGNTAPCRILQ